VKPVHPKGRGLLGACRSSVVPLIFRYTNRVRQAGKIFSCPPSRGG